MNASTSLWNFSQQLIKGQYDVAFLANKPNVVCIGTCAIEVKVGTYKR
jgi:hypothetical protein